MKKTYPLRSLCGNEDGEYVLGHHDLDTHACYLIYGELGPGETGRKACPGLGHEEILLAVSGDIAVCGGDDKLLLREGEAVHLVEDETFYLENPGNSRAVYVMAGGHSGKSHH